MKYCIDKHNVGPPQLSGSICPDFEFWPKHFKVENRVVVVAPLVVWLLPTPEVRDSNQVIGKKSINSWNDENYEIEAGNDTSKSVNSI